MIAPSWQWDRFDDLGAADMYALLALRQEVFVVEQQCIFPDIDWHDQAAHHLLGWQDANADAGANGDADAGANGDTEGGARTDGLAPKAMRRRLAAYLRCLPPGEKFGECSIGRVVTSPAVRGSGMGRLLMAEGLARLETLWPGQPVRIGAQLHLERFYASFGFVTASAPYDEDNILHIEMLRPAQ